MRTGCMCLFCWLHCLYSVAQMHPSAGKWSRLFVTSVAPFDNPSAFASIKEFSLRSAHFRPFMIEGVSTAQLCAVLPLGSSSSAGLAVDQYRTPFYRSLSINAGYGLQLNKHFKLGVRFGSSGEQFSGYENRRGWMAALGMQYENNKIATGFYFERNGYQVLDQKKYRDRIVFGLGRDWSENLYADFELRYTTGEQFCIQSSLIYTALQHALMAVRMETQPFRYGFEIGFQMKQWTILINGMRVPAIGWTPGIVLGFKSKKRKTGAE